MANDNEDFGSIKVLLLSGQAVILFKRAARAIFETSAQLKKTKFEKILIFYHHAKAKDLG